MATVSPSERPESHSDQPWAYSLHLPHDPRAASIARATLRAVLRNHGMPQLLDPAELLTSEMVTNAYRHTEGPAQIRFRWAAGLRLRVSVWDTDPRIPEPFCSPPSLLDRYAALAEAAMVGEAGCGRGLLLVRLWADDWGGRSYGDERITGGKLLWFELSADRGDFGTAA
jgi:anti-sigma regulatory factor (Ser/Thr protein kinase)